MTKARIVSYQLQQTNQSNQTCRHLCTTQKFDGAAGQRVSDTVVPETVRHNVKNMTGFRGAAERGFLATYPDCIHTLLEHTHPDLKSWNTQVLTYNLSTDVVGPRFGMLVPITYYHLGKDSSDKVDMHEAQILGWCVELLRASRVVVDDTVGLDTNTSNINRPFDYKSKLGAAAKATKKVKWGTKHNLGSRAFADAMVLDNSVPTLIKHYFSTDDPRTDHFYHSFQESFNWTTLGRSLQYNVKRSATLPDKTIDISKYTMYHYKTMIKSRITFTNYCLPMSLAMHLRGISAEHMHQAAHKILNELGYYSQLKKDYKNCFVDVDNEAIQRGWLTWPIVVAMQFANASQRQVLRDCYGDEDNEANAARVMEVYNSLHLKKMMQSNIDETNSTIQQRIQQISKVDNFGLTQDFFFRIMDAMSLNNIP